LRCGKNIFSQWSRHHLWSQVTSYNTSEWPTVFCKFNRFDNRERGEPDYKIRKPEEINRGINIDNDITPESIDFDDGQEIYINCEDPEEFETCEPVQIVCEYYPYNYGSLPESSEEVVDDMFWSAYNDFCSDMLNCECDRLRLEDAL
jgi:hypothetical protein